MPHATPPSPPKSREDDLELFDMSLLASSSLPPAIDDEAASVVVIAPNPAPRETPPLDTYRTAAPRVARPFWTKGSVQAAAAFALGALVALGMSASGTNDPVTPTVADVEIAPEGVATKARPMGIGAAASVSAALEAPAHVDAAERETITEPVADRPSTSARPGRDDSDVPAVVIAAEDEPSTDAADETRDVEAPAPAPEAPRFDAGRASMGDLLDHAVAHLDDLSLPTHGEPAAAPAPTPEPSVEEAPAPAGPAREDVQRVMEALRPAIVECAAGGHGLTHVQLTVAPNGRAGAPRISGPFAGSAEGSCMARAARTAEFPAYEGDEPVTLRYPYRL